MLRFHIRASGKAKHEHAHVSSAFAYSPRHSCIRVGGGLSGASVQMDIPRLCEGSPEL